MPWNEINLGDQHSQEMTISGVYDNHLVCYMDGFSSSYDITQVSVDVSRPQGLRRADYEGKGEYSYHHPNTRKILTGSRSGEYELVTPLYKTGEKIFVTKLIADPVDTSSLPSTSGLLTNSTVDIFVDENRAGRSWAYTGSSGGGIPSGYKPKCIVFCENGNEVSGQVLFKTGCEDTSEGTGQAATNLGSGTSPNLNSGEIATSGGFTSYLYYGPKSSDAFTDENNDQRTFFNYSGNGQPIRGFDSKPTTHDASFPLNYYYSGYSGGNYYASVTAGNYVAYKLPSGTKAKASRIGTCTYTIPEVGEKVEAFEGNTFANGIYYHLLSNSTTSGCFGCGTYWVGISGDGSSVTGTVTATGWVKGSEKCEDTDLANSGNAIFFYNNGCSEGGIFSDVPTYNHSVSKLNVNPYYFTPSTSASPITWSNPHTRVELGIGPPSSTVCSSSPNVEVFNNYSDGDVSLEMQGGSGARILIDFNDEGSSLYTWIPFIGATFLLRPKDSLGSKLNISQGIELYTDNKYFVYTVPKDSVAYCNSEFDSVLAVADHSDGGGEKTYGNKILLKLNHTSGTPSQPLGTSGWLVENGDPVAEYVTVVSTGYCN